MPNRMPEIVSQPARLELASTSVRSHESADGMVIVIVVPVPGVLSALGDGVRVAIQVPAIVREVCRG